MGSRSYLICVRQDCKNEMNWITSFELVIQFSWWCGWNILAHVHVWCGNMASMSSWCRHDQMPVSEWVISKFNGTSTPKGSYRAKTGDNDCNVHSSHYSLSTALCERIRYQATSEHNVRQDLIPGVHHGEAALCTPIKCQVHEVSGPMQTSQHAFHHTPS